MIWIWEAVVRQGHNPFLSSVSSDFAEVHLRLKFYPSPSNSLSICDLHVHMPGSHGVIRSGNVTFVLGAIYFIISHYVWIADSLK